jgi:oligopeptide transport system substrate-binding protein
MKLPHRLRWLWLFTAIALIAVLAIAGCKEDKKTGGKTPTPGAGERIEGGDLIAQGIEFESIDPHYSAFAQDISVLRMMWRGLYRLDPENVPKPAMAAADPEITNDGKTYTIELRSGLKWSDGDDLLAEDFVAGIIRTCNPLHAGLYQYLLTAIAGCDDYYYSLAGPDETPGTDDDLDASTIDAAAMEAAIGAKALDDTTIEFTLTDPQPTFQMILSLWMTFPSPVHLLPNSADEWPDGLTASELAFNGPYQMMEYKPQQHLKMEPNPNWSPAEGEDTPTLDTLTIKFIDDAAVSNNAYRNDELDFALADQAVLTQVVQEFGDEYLKLIQPATRGLEMQLTDPTLAKLEVRLALAQAIDREQLVKVAANDAHVPTTSWFPEAIVGGVPPDTFEDTVGFNPDSAKEHLKNAGYENGAGFPKMSILVRNEPLPQAIAAFLQNSFKTVLNINVDIEVVDGQTRASRFSAQEFQLFHGGWIQDYPDPENWVLGQFDVPGVGTNKYNCDNPKIKEKVDQAKFNQDQDARIKLYQEINEIIVTEVCGITPYYHEAQHYLIKPDVVGMKENSSALDANAAGDANAEAWGFRAE